MCQTRSKWVAVFRTFWLVSICAASFAALLPAAEPEKAQKQPELKPDKDGWLNLLDKKALANWKVLDKYDFASHGKVKVSEQSILLEQGYPATGVRWSGDFPKVDYEVSLEARRVYGGDFFCGLTFPVKDKTLTLVCGGWGGQVTGLSCIDGESAIENDTCTFHEYQENLWYRIRLRVTADRIDAWLEEEQIVDLPLDARELSLRWEMEPAEPFGVCTWNTSGELRKFRYRPLKKNLPVESQDSPARAE